MGQLQQAFGTIEVGKNADLILLHDNPLENIRNIRTLEQVIAQGRVIDLGSLPENRIFYLGPGRKSVERQSEQPADKYIPPTAIVAGEVGSKSDDDHQPIPTQDMFGDNLLVESIRKAPYGNLMRVKLPTDISGLSAEIKPSFLGSVTMKIEGSSRSFKVSRIN